MPEHNPFFRPTDHGDVVRRNYGPPRPHMSFLGSLMHAFGMHCHCHYPDGRGFAWAYPNIAFRAAREACWSSWYGPRNQAYLQQMYARGTSFYGVPLYLTAAGTIPPGLHTVYGQVNASVRAQIAQNTKHPYNPSNLPSGVTYDCEITPNNNAVMDAFANLGADPKANQNTQQPQAPSAPKVEFPKHTYPYDINQEYSKISYSSDRWKEGLEQHGISFELSPDGNYKMYIISTSSPDFKLDYKLTPEQYKSIIPDELNSLDTTLIQDYENCIANINNIISKDYKDRITATQLASNKVINISLKDEVLAEMQAQRRAVEEALGQNLTADAHAAAVGADENPDKMKYVDMSPADAELLVKGDVRYKGKLEQLDNGMVRVHGDRQEIMTQYLYGIQDDSGLSRINIQKSWYMKGDDGRRVSVSDIDIHQNSTNYDYTLSYKVNGKEYTQQISEKEFNKNYRNLTDEKRMEQIAKWSGFLEIRKVEQITPQTLYYGTKDTGRLLGTDLMSLDASLGFYRPGKNGRAVEVDDIRVFTDAERGKYYLQVNMSAALGDKNREDKTIELTEKQYNEYMRRSDLGRMKYACELLPDDLALKDRDKEERIQNKWKLTINPEGLKNVNLAKVDQSRTMMVGNDYVVKDARILSLNMAPNTNNEYILTANIDGEIVSAKLTQKQVEKLNKAKDWNDVSKVFCDVYGLKNRSVLTFLDKMSLGLDVFAYNFGLGGPSPMSMGGPLVRIDGWQGGVPPIGDYYAMNPNQLAAQNFDSAMNQNQGGKGMALG